MYSILKYPENESFLRKKSVKINVVDSIIKQTLQDMTQVMYNEKGIGLAAPQIGVFKRLVVVDIGFTGVTYKMINPCIVEKSDETFEVNEGCLSIPGITGPILRSKKITVKYTDEKNRLVILKAEELLSICIQHEIDHLNGVLFIDNLKQSENKRLTSSGLPL